MTNTFVPPNRDALDGELLRTLEPIRLSWTGVAGKGVALTNTAVSDAAQYALDAANAGTDKKALRAVADSHSLTVNGSGITLSSAAVTGNVTIGGTLRVDGNTTLGDNASDTLTVNAVSTFVAAVNTQAATNLGNGAGDLTTVIDLLKVQNAGGTLFPLYVDGANGRAQIGSTTAMSTAPDSVLEVNGRAYVAPASAGDAALSLRRSAASTNGWDLGVSSAADLLFKDDAGVERFRVGDGASTYQATVTGALNVTTTSRLGSTTALGSTGNSRVEVIGGRLYVAAGGEEYQVGLRYGIATGTYHLGATNDADPSLRLRDNGGDIVATFGHNGSTYQLDIVGAGHLSGGLTVDGNLDQGGGTSGNTRTGALIANATSLSSTEKIRCGGNILIEGDVVISGTRAISGTLKAPATDPPTVLGQITAGSQCQGWASVTYSAGAPTLQDSYNVLNVVDDGTGIMTVTWDRDFANTNYAILVGYRRTGAGALCFQRVVDQQVGTCQIETYTSGGVAVDPLAIYVTAFGTLS